MQESATGSFSHIPSVFLRENWHLECLSDMSAHIIFHITRFSLQISLHPESFKMVFYEIRLVDRSYISARLILYLDYINHRCLYSILLISCHLNVVNLLYFMEVLIKRLLFRLQYFSFPLTCL